MKNREDKTIFKRLIGLILIFFTLFSILIGRLYIFQIQNHEDLKMQALKQRGEEIQLSPNRGIIFDRNLYPLTNNEKSLIGLVYRKTIEEDDKVREFILDHSKLTLEELNELLKEEKNMVALPFKEGTDRLEDTGDIYFANRISRYNKDHVLSHVIGYVNKSDNRGKTGIERAYDDILSMVENETLILEVDKKQNIILGGEYAVDKEVSPSSPSGVQLTIDYQVQKSVEDILDKREVRGAAIVSQIDGDILAMASRPNFKPEVIEEFLNNEDMTLFNKGIQVSYPPGSIFKIVVLLAALEEDIDFTNRVFYCRGYEEFNNGKPIRCNNIYGHGYLTLKEGFAQSCNSVFIQLGRELGGRKILEMARKLGFSTRVNIGLLEEKEGILPSDQDVYGAAIGNISIGQGSIEATPLQISNMMMIIANQGIQKDMALVKGLTNKTGNMIKRYNREEDKRILSPEICRIGREYLNNVLIEGTAKNIDLSHIGNGGGKTGSAQAVLKGRETIHGWFSGYVPADDPQYIITVFVEEGRSGAQAAAPIFEEISKEIYKIYK